MKKAFINGRIRTIDEKNSLFEGMISNDGVITLLGSNEDILKESEECEIIDLKGKDVLPGFIDAHIHLLDNAIFNKRTAILTETKSVDDVIHIMKEYIEKNNMPEGQWVKGFGWDQEQFPGGKFPTCKDLDKITDKHPLMLDRRCGTICAVNSMAMRIAKIDRNTLDPQGGALVRFEDGSPTGVMLESAMSLIGDYVPKLSDKKVIKELLEYSFEEMVKNGVTVCHTEDFYSVGNKQTLWEAYLELYDEGKIPINLVLQLRIHRPSQLQEFFDFGFKSWQRFGKIKIGPIKFLGDGSLGAWSAGLKEPYSDKPETNGCLYWNYKELRDIAKTIVDNDFDLTIHAIGDAAVEMFLDGCISIKDEILKKGLRPSIIHSQIMNESIFEKYKEVDAVALVQPMYIHSDWRIADSRVGERMKTSYCFDTMRKRGIRVAAGSDLPIESANPFHGIQVNVTRKDLSGKPDVGWYPEERMTRLEAIKLHTIYGAYVSKDEDKLGSLEVGKYANFCVVSDDVFTVPEDEIKDIKVLETFINGDLCFKCKK